MLDVETLGAALKLAKKGGGGGGEGGSGAVIDDSKISSSTTWSSQKIVDTLCPPFTTSGAIVQCYPVANYPLGVKASWEPRQEGSGDPSPENVRPIVGLDSVKVTRCGKNLLPYTKPSNPVYSSNGITYTWHDDGSIHVAGTPTAPTDSNVMNFSGFYLPPGDYILGSTGISGLSLQLVVQKASTGSNEWYNRNVTIEPGDVPQYFYVWCKSGITVDATVYTFLTYGDNTLTANDYAPYTGTTATLALPETIYGGTVDAVTGEGSKTWGYIASYNGEPLPGEWISDRDVYSAGATPTTGAQVAYKLATPTAFQATGNAFIPALPGTNTVYTDAGVVTVSGLSDTVETFNALENRIAALEEAAISG